MFVLLAETNIGVVASELIQINIDGKLLRATARKMALPKLNQLSDQESIKNRRKIAAWDDASLKSMF